MQSKLPWFLRYALALAAVGAGLLLRLALTQWVGPNLPTFITFYPAVILVALIGGFGPGLLATVAAALATDYWVITPYQWFGYESRSEEVALVFFAGMGVLMSAVAGLYRHIRNHLAELVAVRTHELAGANARLSQQVEERTRAAEELRNSRAAALNLMEDAIRARRQTEEAAADLRESEERLRVATGQPPRYNIQVESETT